MHHETALYNCTEMTVRSDAFCEYKPVISWSLEIILVIKKIHSLADSILATRSNYFSYKRITNFSLQGNRNHLFFVF